MFRRVTVLAALSTTALVTTLTGAAPALAASQPDGPVATGFGGAVATTAATPSTRRSPRPPRSG